MHDNYVGDIGDFMKFGLLRLVARHLRDGRGAVVWFATREAGGSAGDGRHLDYLRDPEFRRVDSELIDRLGAVVAGGRRLARLEQAGLLPSSTRWFREALDAPAATRREHRREWLRRAGATLEGADWVFADPDNGVASEKVKEVDARARKYAFLDELQALAPAERTLVVYQHAHRYGTHATQANELRDRLSKAFPHHCTPVVVEARRVSPRFFGVVATKRHGSVVQGALDELSTGAWSSFMEVVR